MWVSRLIPLRRSRDASFRVGVSESPAEPFVALLIVQVLPRFPPRGAAHGHEILPSLECRSRKRRLAAGVLVVMRHAVEPSRGSKQSVRSDQQLAFDLGLVARARAKAEDGRTAGLAEYGEVMA